MDLYSSGPYELFILRIKLIKEASPPLGQKLKVTGRNIS